MSLIAVEFLMFDVTPIHGLRYVWFTYPTYPVLCWFRCPEIGASSIDWAKLNKTE
jgi:hypothetical protein